MKISARNQLKDFLFKWLLPPGESLILYIIFCSANTTKKRKERLP